ncbi:MAG: amino acid ABC transporter substrate-binding protein [Gammaproteobacteria bacterium]|uniref:Uncharacterized protein n=1 Tax=Marinobacter litoralis TaxID=187981 RepID=A0A3M2RL80_9GAMM|nr:transporter substrate-binding domain-containing protein [Marinobacter litoralis]MBR9870499.1 amino acid ABC transporter substrate-binding protein [Gammaproteobacteria bacterium]RMJ05932.1 hypothetical protein DOQ08_00608 [Marinobacter litoralis]
MMHGRKHLIAWMLITLCVSTTSQATEPQKELKIAAIIDVAITAATTEFLQLAYERLDVSMQTLHTPSRRALMMANTGMLDGDLFRIEQAAFDYPNLVRVDYPLLLGELHAVVRPGEGDLLSTPSAKPKTAAIRRGIIIAEQTAKAMGLELVQANTYEQVRALLESGRVDTALVADIQGFGPLALESWQEFEILPAPVATFTLFHYLNRRHEELAKALPAILADLEKDGMKTKILRKFRKKQRKWDSEEYSTGSSGTDSAPNNPQSLLKRLLYFL